MTRRLLRVLWLAAVAASLAIGARELRTKLVALPEVPFAPRTSSDAYLAAVARGGSVDSIRRALAALPGDDAVVFVGPEGDPQFTQALYTFSFLAWPRELGGILCSPAGGPGSVIVPLDADREIAGVVFFRLEPGTAAVRRLAPGVSLLRVAPRAATSPWNLFCPSPPRPSS